MSIFKQLGMILIRISQLGPKSCDRDQPHGSDPLSVLRRVPMDQAIGPKRDPLGRVLLNQLSWPSGLDEPNRDMEIEKIRPRAAKP